MSHTLILTCAGESTRFHGQRPKWTLTHPSGHMMAAEALRGCTGWDRLVVALREQHMQTFPLEQVASEFAHAGYSPELCVVGNTGSHVETVREAVKRAGITGRFSTRDCDSGFQYELPSGGCVVAVGNICTLDRSVRVAGKGFVRAEGGTVRSLVEGEVLSPLFLAGAYSFDDAAAFLACSEQHTRVSSVVQSLVDAGARVSWKEVVGYEDWNTLQAWTEYRRSWAALFVDIDGVLVANGHRTFLPAWGSSPLNTENVNALNQLHATGRVYIVLTTSREEAARAATQQQLQGLRYDQLVMGLPHCRRILVNDHLPSRGERTAEAVNVVRDAADLSHVLASFGLVA